MLDLEQDDQEVTQEHVVDNINAEEESTKATLEVENQGFEQEAEHKVEDNKELENLQTSYTRNFNRRAKEIQKPTWMDEYDTSRSSFRYRCRKMEGENEIRIIHFQEESYMKCHSQCMSKQCKVACGSQ